jgi:hypothetical protein
MKTMTKVGAYALGLAAVFAGAAGVGNLVGPVDATAKASAGGHGEMAAHGAPSSMGHAGSGQGGTGSEVPGGLQISQDGYTLVPRTTTVTPGHRTDFRFAVTGPDGRPVTRYTALHGKKLHFIVARRDLTGFQHLHPVEAGGGVWSVPLTLPAAGTYRVFTDIRPVGAPRQLTLGMDLTAPGDYRPTTPPQPERTAHVDGYTVRLAGDLAPGRTSKLTLSVSKAGRPVTDLQPYLQAYGHLVALRAGDLAYLHVHPDGEPGDGTTRPGPDITFYAEVPSSGTYRLYLDFQHQGTVRTAAFTMVAGGDHTETTSPGHPTAPHGH